MLVRLLVLLATVLLLVSAARLRLDPGHDGSPLTPVAALEADAADDLDPDPGTDAAVGRAGASLGLAPPTPTPRQPPPLVDGRLHAVRLFRPPRVLAS